MEISQAISSKTFMLESGHAQPNLDFDQAVFTYMNDAVKIFDNIHKILYPL